MLNNLRWLFCLSALVLSSAISIAQKKTTLTEANADCSGIIDLLPKDTVFGPTTQPIGSGAVMEISGDEFSLYHFEKEHNTVWYRFRAPKDCILTFEIIPLSLEDDYDFILYPFTGRTFCSDVASDRVKPVRSCISRNDPVFGSVTGLKNEAPDKFIHSGPGPSYSTSLEVHEGDIFVLVIDNVYPGGKGHTLKLHYRAPSQQTADTQAIALEKTALTVSIFDAESGEPMNANARILNSKKENNTPFAAYDSVTSFSTDLNLSEYYILQIEAPDYFDYSREIKTKGKGENLVIRAELNKIVVGKSVVFDNILFVGNEARLLSESIPVLESLLATMKKNPRLVIEIQGHVNCPASWASCQTRKMQDWNMSLSVNRARAVYMFLIDNGIAPTRMSYQGFGATRMKYPDARSEDKMEKNRRVEIVVVSN